MQLKQNHHAIQIHMFLLPLSSTYFFPQQTYANERTIVAFTDQRPLSYLQAASCLLFNTRTSPSSEGTLRVSKGTEEENISA